jgi:hypothetical protein
MQVDRRRWSITTCRIRVDKEGPVFRANPDGRSSLWGDSTLFGGHGVKGPSIGVAASRGRGWDHVNGLTRDKSSGARRRGRSSRCGGRKLELVCRFHHYCAFDGSDRDAAASSGAQQQFS